MKNLICGLLIVISSNLMAQEAPDEVTWGCSTRIMKASELAQVTPPIEDIQAGVDEYMTGMIMNRFKHYQLHINKSDSSKTLYFEQALYKKPLKVQLSSENEMIIISIFHGNKLHSQVREHKLNGSGLFLISEVRNREILVNCNNYDVHKRDLQPHVNHTDRANIIKGDPELKMSNEELKGFGEITQQ